MISGMFFISLKRYYLLKQHFGDLMIFEKFVFIFYFLKVHYDLHILGFGMFVQVLVFPNMKSYYYQKLHFDDLMIFGKFVMVQNFFNIKYYYLNVVNYSDYLSETLVQAQQLLEMIYYFKNFVYFLDDLMIFGNFSQAFVVQQKICYYFYCNEMKVFEKLILVFMCLILINF